MVVSAEIGRTSFIESAREAVAAIPMISFLVRNPPILDEFYFSLSDKGFCSRDAFSELGKDIMPFDVSQEIRQKITLN